MEHGLWTLIQLSLAGSLLALAVLAVTRLFRGKISRTGAYYLWLLVLLRLILPVGLPGVILSPLPQEAPTLDRSAWTAAQAPVSVQTEPGAQGSAGTAAPSPDLPSPVREETTSLPSDSPLSRDWVLPILWLTGAAASMGWFTLSYVRFRRTLRETNLPPQPEDQRVLNDFCPQERLALWCNPTVPTPMLVGFLRPVILLPRLRYVDQGREEELRCILRHELTHYRRQDILYKWAVAAVTSLHWFNPLMILIRREIARACELACDEGAVKGMDPDQRKAYSHTLLALATEQPRPAPALTTAWTPEMKRLRERLLSVLGHRKTTRAMVTLALVLAVTLTACGGALGPARQSEGTAARSDPWLSGAEEAVTARYDWLSRWEVRELRNTFDGYGEEFQLSLSLPLGDGGYPDQPWTIGLNFYEDTWTQGNPYVLWDIKRQSVVNENLSRFWMTIEEWSYRGLLRVTLLTDLRTRDVWTGEETSPSAIGSISVIQPGCLTARGIGVGSTLEALQAAYPELQLRYENREMTESHRSRGLVDHDACWRFAPGTPEDADLSGPTILFLVKGDRVVQIDYMTDCSGEPWGLGYYLSDWAYQAGYLLG